MPDEIITGVVDWFFATGRAVIVFSDGIGIIRGPSGAEGAEAVRRLSKSRRTRGGELAGGGVV